MTSDEGHQLMNFLNRSRQQRGQPKDPLADGLISEALPQRPDALYPLLRRCMALQLVLDGAAQRVTARVVASGWLLEGLTDDSFRDVDIA